MRKIARKIIHYVGVAIKMPFVALFAASYLAIYLLQLASVAVRVAFDEPHTKEPLNVLMGAASDVVDSLEELIV